MLETIVNGNSSDNRRELSYKVSLSKSVMSTKIAKPAMMRGPSVLLVTSDGLGWEGITVERHLAPPGEKAQVATTHHVITFLCGKQPSYGERADCKVGSRSIPCHQAPSVVLTEGLLRAIHPVTETELIACALDKSSIDEMMDEVAGIGGSGLPVQ
jgi:hypothetical protein